MFVIARPQVSPLRVFGGIAVVALFVFLVLCTVIAVPPAFAGLTSDVVDQQALTDEIRGLRRDIARVRDYGMVLVGLLGGVSITAVPGASRRVRGALLSVAAASPRTNQESDHGDV